MGTIRTALAVFLLSSFLTLGNPLPVRAYDFYEMPPAVVFVRNSDSKMLLEHNFKLDDGIFSSAYSDDIDKGIYVRIQ